MRVTSTRGSCPTGEKKRKKAEKVPPVEGPQPREWAVAVQVREGLRELMEDR